MASESSGAAVSLTSTAALVAEKAAKLSELLKGNNIADPSLDESSHDPYAREDSAVRRARSEVSSAAMDLVQLSQGPEEQIMQMAWAATDSNNLGVLVRFDIP
ncbi:Uu.00g056260.m01.CDS01 [Anthostomella pinea]|uniref:Uu.00g056260.m01.CDS01 n=1 Tax=Anthostomella pinea TaxID=933095 RepID=A0AAI8VRI3_9PEZI|nr:Uu.00g056260.m01.CDS01 [Anthostomella pinea]